MQGRINNDTIYEVLAPDATMLPPAPGTRPGYSKHGKKPSARAGADGSAFPALNLLGDEEAGGDEDPNMGWLTTYPVGFSDIVREQRGTEAVEPTKVVHENIYRHTRNSTYKILVLLTGAIFAFVWGFLFGVSFYMSNWFCSPLVYFVRRSLYCVSLMFRAALRGIFEPCYGGLEFIWNALRFFRSESSTIGAVMQAI